MGELKYMIAVPCMDAMPTPFVAALTALKRVGLTKHSFLANSLVYDARNMLAQEAIDTGADRVLFLDSDMFFKPDMMERMAADLDTGIDFVTGISFKRRFPTMPCIYKDVGIDYKNDRPIGNTEVFEDYPQDKLFQVAGCGFGAVMMNVSMLSDIWDKYGKPFLPIPGALGEDLTFCYRAQLARYKLWCDSRIKVKHIGQFFYGESHWLAQREAQK